MTICKPYNQLINAKNTSEEKIRRCCFMLIVKNLCIASKAVKIIKILTVIKFIVAVFAFGLIIKNTVCAVSE